MEAVTTDTRAATFSRAPAIATTTTTLVPAAVSHGSSLVQDDQISPTGSRDRIVHTSPVSIAGFQQGSDDRNNDQSTPARAKPRQRNRRKPVGEEVEEDPAKRRCVSTACIACRKRKSKCDGNLPACAACSQVYNTDCVYDPNSDLRRKGVYKNDFDGLKTRGSTLQTLIQAILNYPEEDVVGLVREIRTCESLDAVADRIVAKEQGLSDENGEDDATDTMGMTDVRAPKTFEQQLSGKLGDLRIDDGSVRYFGGTSNLILLAPSDTESEVDEYDQQEDPITSWTEVTDDADLVMHLLDMYFTWHYTFFTTLSKTLFYRDFLLGKPPSSTRRKTQYCTSLLVNAILALGCHFTSRQGARDDPDDSATAGDHFFREAKRLIMMNDEHEKPRTATVQALALMSVREAGCGREARGWVYSGMSFRMACDMGLNLDSGRLTANKHINGDDAEEDARRITFWGCFLFDKCWSNYLGRLPQLPAKIATMPKPDVFPEEDAAQWVPCTDSGFTQSHAQPARTRAVALQITKLCEISDDLMRYFYNPIDIEKTKGKAVELKKLSDIHTRLEAWRKELPKEMEPREGGLSSVLTMHMYFQLLFIHLFRPFLKYTEATSPLPSTVSPRRLCTQAAAMISKLLRLYKRSYGLRQICNIAVYIAHSACTIHLLNLPDKNAKRDITHGLKHLEEISEGWLCARRTLGVLSVLARKWKVELPDEAAAVFARTDIKYANYVSEVHTPSTVRHSPDRTTPPLQNTAAPFMTQPLAFPSTSFTSPTASLLPSKMPSMMPQYESLHERQVPMTSNSMAAMTIPAQETRRLRAAVSPGDMFGGVEQLLRDGQNWVYRDQAQYATGFENWHASLEADPSPAWPITRPLGDSSGHNRNARSTVGLNQGSFQRNSSNGLGTPSTIHESRSGSTMPYSSMNDSLTTSPISHVVPDVHVNGSANTNTNVNGNVAGAMDLFEVDGWMDAMGNIAAYDEDEWYQ